MNTKALTGVAVLLSYTLSAGMVVAMDDPTRPPAGLYNTGSAQSGPAPEGPVLQSVLISRTQHLAIISGQLVPIGSTVAGGRLVKVSETEVVLQQGAARKTLKLLPGAEKRAPGALAHREASRIGATVR